MMRSVRTTVTLDPDVETLVKRAMKERGLSFKEAINEAIRAGMAIPTANAVPELPVHDMGEPLVDVTHALRVAAELENQELSKRLARGT
jgi:hypothetical protein